MLLISSLEAAGAERQVVTLANELDPTEFEVHICSLSPHVPLADRLNGSARLHIISKNRRFDITIVPRLAALMRRLRIDLVHTFLFDAQLAGRLASPWAGVRVTVSSERNSDYIRPWWQTAALRLTRPLSDALVTNSHAGKCFNVRTLFLSAQHIYVVYNGVDTEVFRPRRVDALRKELRIRPDDTVVGMVAHFKRQKNHGMFFEVARRLLSEHPNTWFVCVGEPLRDGQQGSDLYHQQMARRVEELGIRDRCLFLGTRSDMADVYNLCDVTVLTSRREGTPNVLLEAMASGVPSVVTDVADNARHVLNGTTGYVVPLDDAKAMAGRVSILLSDAEGRAAMGKAARRRACDDYSVQIMTEQMADVYRAVLARKKLRFGPRRHRGASRKGGCSGNARRLAREGQDFAGNGKCMSARQPFRTTVVPRVACQAVHCLLGAIGMLARWGRMVQLCWPSVHRGRDRTGRTVLVTGTFPSENWFRAHLRPLARAESVNRLLVVCDDPFDALDNIRYLCPPPWLRRVFGRTAARALTLLWVAFRNRPDLVMGYHIMPNALLCLGVASLIGARSAYQMTGGPRQVIGGGYGSENPLLRRLGRPWPRLEQAMFRTIRQFDLVVVRGHRALDFVRRHRLTRNALVIPASIDLERFNPNGHRPSTDLVCVSRLVPVKRLERALTIVAHLAKLRPEVRLVIVGDGPLASELRQCAGDLGITGHIDFMGHRSDVESILPDCRVFLLTSETEGLSIAMAEAMAAGLPAVVPDIGELRDLVTDGLTGLIIDPDDAMGSANRLAALLDNPPCHARMSAAARQAVAGHNSIERIADVWNRLFTVWSNTVKPDRSSHEKQSDTMTAQRAVL